MMVSVAFDCRALGRCSSFSLAAESSESSGSVTRGIMRALLRTPLVQEVLEDVDCLLKDNADIHDADDLATVFNLLHLPFNQEAASQQDMNQCFYLSAAGTQTDFSEMYPAAPTVV